ncbi:uncharacterized protein CDV56_103926 [Aspergillus thermomutatus]|uniref:Lysine-specific metallo-endopeptidase domain-containing protein n=1 Tax=Aspergillus thermomutatus TaxID=41047 RepID=A0A397GF00_ASPTH|nr:uncharacterized protein CDV56_103926 [Aspergillus thermomutatus]RHZ48404.1 hypothetical protein CDV56_103926 [Aspergillus thermomutatus]
MTNIASMVGKVFPSRVLCETNNSLLKLTNTRTGLTTIKNNLGTARRELSTDDKAKLDLFMALYGIFDPTDKDAITAAETRITKIDWYAQQLLGALGEDDLAIDVFCNDDHLVRVEYQKEDGSTQVVYASSAVPAMVDNEMNGKCADEEGLRAFMQETVADKTGRVTMDVLTICPVCWDDQDGWIEHLSEQTTRTVDEMLDEYLDDIVSASGEVTILHELMHTESFFTSSFVMEDEQQDSGTEAYKWENCYDLAQDTSTRASAMTNAGEFAPLVSMVPLQAWDLSF